MGRTKLTPAQLLYGIVRSRQGGTSGDNDWSQPGTTNTDTSAKQSFIQVGTATTSSSARITITFPTAFNQVPVVFAMGLSQTTFYTPIAETVSTTTFTLDAFNTSNARVAASVMWIAIGQ